MDCEGRNQSEVAIRSGLRVLPVLRMAMDLQRQLIAKLLDIYPNHTQTMPTQYVDEIRNLLIWGGVDIFAAEENG